MEQKNCWEAMVCGREPGGQNAEELGVCPAAGHSKYNGTNRGTYSGRFCWLVTGTFCSGRPQGTRAKELMDCLNCEFFKQVNQEQGHFFVLLPEDIRKYT
jgi:hypothetical protein